MGKTEDAENALIEELFTYFAKPRGREAPQESAATT